MSSGTVTLTVEGGPAFEGWAVLELMGHRRLAGYVREVTLAGAGVLRIDVPSHCVGGAGATWCAEHGACGCLEPPRDVMQCPLHSPDSRHGVEGSEVHATQFYSPSALYCLTPATEREARRVAALSRPAPFVRYEKAPAAALAAAPQADGDGGDDDDEFDDLDPDDDPIDDDDLGEAGA